MESERTGCGGLDERGEEGQSWVGVGVGGGQEGEDEEKDEEVHVVVENVVEEGEKDAFGKES